MKRTRTSIVLIVFVATAGAAAARTAPEPPVLVPGAAEITTTHLRNAAGSYRYLARMPTGDTTEHETGTGRTEQVLMQHNGKPAVMLVSSFSRKDQTFVDSALVMRSGLVPVWETSRFGSRVTRYDYAGKEVRLTITSPDSGTRTRQHTYDVPVFHFNELDVLIRSLPLRAGYEAILPLYSEGSDELEMDTVRVMSQGADGVWSIRFADPAIVATYGIHGTTREFIKQEVLQRKSGGHARKVPVQ